MVHFDKISLLCVKCSIWSATKKLNINELDISERELPNGIATPGSLRLINPDSLIAFRQIRTKTEAICRSYGARFCGSFIVPEDKIILLREQLEQLKNEFYQIRDEFVKSYNNEREIWLNTYSQFRELLSAYQPDVLSIENKFQFDFLWYRLSSDDSDNLKKALDTIVDDQLDCFAEFCEEYYSQLNDGRTYCTQRTLKTFKLNYEKIGNIGSLDHRLNNIAFFCSNLIKNVNSKGYICDQTFVLLKTVIKKLCNKDFLLQISLSDGESILNLINQIKNEVGVSPSNQLEIVISENCEISNSSDQLTNNFCQQLRDVKVNNDVFNSNLVGTDVHNKLLENNTKNDTTSKNCVENKNINQYENADSKENESTETQLIKSVNGDETIENSIEISQDGKSKDDSKRDEKTIPTENNNCSESLTTENCSWWF